MPHIAFDYCRRCRRAIAPDKARRRGGFDFCPDCAARAKARWIGQYAESRTFKIGDSQGAGDPLI